MILNCAYMELSTSATIKEPTLRELIEAQATVQATVAGQERGFAVFLQLGTGEKVLATTRGGIRLFASLDTAGAFIRNVGIPRFEVDMTNHEPGRLRSARPDRA